jgi:uncharacterized membrane protein YdjX (TVP38/TMEM64 family)
VEKNGIKRLITKLITVMLCIAMSVVSYIFLRHLPKYILVLLIALFATMGVSIACINGKKFEALYKILVFAVATAAFILTCYVALDVTGVLDKITSFEVLKQLILDTRQWGVIVFLLLTVFQVVVLPIPAIVTVLIGVAIYGPTWSFILSTAGTLIGSFICFVLGKVFGKKLVTWMIGKEKTEKYSAMLNDKGHFAFALMLLFPCFPDDILCLVAGISSMSYRYFIIVTCLTRPVMIAFYSFFGSGSIIPFSGWGIPVWISLFCIAFVAFMLMNKLKDIIMSNKRKVGKRKTVGEMEVAEMHSLDDSDEKKDK